MSNVSEADLPKWDLSDLYPDLDDPSVEQDFKTAEAEAEQFASDYEGKLVALDAEGLLTAVTRYEAMQERIGRLMSFAGLQYATDSTNPKISEFYGNAQDRATRLGTKIIFFDLEMNRIEEARLNDLCAENKDLARYRPWIDDQRLFRPYQLSDEVEKLLHEKSVSGRTAWMRLFDETMTDLQFSVDGKTLGLEETLSLLFDPKRDVRKEAAFALADVLEENSRLFTLITNTLAKDKEIEDRWRQYPDPATPRHLSNAVEQEVVEALVSAVKNAYPRLSHRFYALKSKWLGLDQMEFWDRNAPLPDEDEREISWDQAKDIVLTAYRAFSPELAEVGKTFFDNPWIDAETRRGKAQGAFAHPTVPSAHPYLLMSFQGKTRDVMTLAHELGHGVHQVLAGPQGALLSDTPLTLAETASVFGEMLTFQSLLKNAEDNQQRKAMLASKVQDMLNTVVRQIAFYEFERLVHTERRTGELTADRLGEIWMQVQSESFGPSIRLDEKYQSYWSYIPHFIHSPFYVYAYAFGDCLVNSLYAVYEEAEEGFQQKYLDMLRAGGSKRHKELLAPFGLDASDPAFWQKGLSVIERMLDQLEAMD